MIPAILAQADIAPTTTTVPATAPTTQGSEVTKLLHNLDLNTTITQTPLSGWGVLLGAIFVGLTVGKLISLGIRSVARRMSARGWEAYGVVLDSAAGPIYLWVITASIAVGLAPIALSAPVRTFATGVLKLLAIFAVGWFVFEIVALSDLVLKRFIRHTGSTLETQVAPLVRKTLRLFVVIVFTLSAAQNVFGADIGAWLAGLGIAGLAVSLAAQDSIKNLFGSLTIFMDKPFTVGERIVFDSHDGTVEEIGFRSTKIRTGSGEIVTIPNARMVDASVKNFSRRPSILRVFSIGITYDTTPEKLDEALRIVKEILAMPDLARGFDLEKFPPRVFFDELAASSLNLKVWYWYFPGSDWWGYMDHVNLFNRELLRRFNAAGIEFAFPTQTLHVVKDSPDPPYGRQKAPSHGAPGEGE
jgi:MscS family membrane protein